MLSNTLSAEDEEAVQSELQALRSEVVRHLHRIPLLQSVFTVPALQLAPEEQKVPDRVTKLPSVPAAVPAGKLYWFLHDWKSLIDVCAQKPSQKQNHGAARARRGESVYPLQHSSTQRVCTTSASRQSTLLYSLILHSGYPTTPRSCQNPASVSSSVHRQRLHR